MEKQKATFPRFPHNLTSEQDELRFISFLSNNVFWAITKDTKTIFIKIYIVAISFEKMAHVFPYNNTRSVQFQTDQVQILILKKEIGTYLFYPE